MRVIKTGTPDKQKTAEVTCSNCHSVIEVAKGECTIHSSARNAAAYIFECPVCSDSVYFCPSKFQEVES